MPATLSIFGGPEHEIQGDETLVGRSEQADIRILDLGCSRRQFQLYRDRSTEQWWIEPLSSSTHTMVNGQTIQERTLLPQECEIRAGTTSLRFYSQGTSTGDSALGEEATLLPDATILADFSELSSPMPDADRITIPLVGGPIRVGRDASAAQFVLRHCQVSRGHAELLPCAGGYRLRDLGSANGTWLNGVAITHEAELQVGDRIRIGPYTLAYTANNLSLVQGAGRGMLACEDVNQYGSRGKSARKILSDISLALESSQFVCILGPTGCGKSTLLSTLSLRLPPAEGNVWLGALDLREHFDYLKPRLAVVPQKELLYGELTVEQALRYTARLRLPQDTSSSEVERLVERMCLLVGLVEHRSKKYRVLSGGQAKRACLANEMIANPEILFLDEVTAGLDEHTDREIMELFRKIADDGKTVVAVTHSLAHVADNCDTVVLLTCNGELAFVGSPSAALDYFGVDHLGEIYAQLSNRRDHDWAQQFLESEPYKINVADKIEKHRASKQNVTAAPKPQPLFATVARYCRQTSLLLSRGINIKLSEWPSLIALLGQCLLVAVLLRILFGNLEALTAETIARQAPGLPTAIGNVIVQSDYTMKILFLISVCAFWFGCNNASKEIVLERNIFTRERDVNLLIESYLSAKLLILFALTVAQTAALLLCSRYLCNLDSPIVDQLLILGITSLCGIGVGLCISACSRTEDMAVKLVPICLIPQLILGGILAPIQGIAAWIAACCIPAYWCFTATCHQLPQSLTDHLTIETNSPWTAVGVLSLHVTAAILATWWMLRFQQSRDSLGRYGIRQIISTSNLFRNAAAKLSIYVRVLSQYVASLRRTSSQTAKR